MTGVTVSSRVRKLVVIMNILENPESSSKTAFCSEFSSTLCGTYHQPLQELQKGKNNKED